jgi:hypothetical protein
MPRDVELLFASEYLRACDLQAREVTVTVAGLRNEDLQMADGSKEPATVLLLAKTEKRLVLSSKTNARGIAVLLGRDPQSWIGKRLVIRPEVDPISGMPCIRVGGSPDAAPERLRAWQVAIDGAMRTKGGARNVPMFLLRALSKVDPPKHGPPAPIPRVDGQPPPPEGGGLTG